MDEANTPSIIRDPPPLNVAQTVSRWRWWVHFLTLAALPVTAGILGLMPRHGNAPLLPRKISSLLIACGEQLLFFGILFGIAWAASRVNRRQLLLPWRGGLWPWVWGLAYSVVLRILILVVAVTAMVFWLLLQTALKRGQPGQFDHSAFRPHIEHLINVNAMTDNPIYFALMVTVVSFVLGGLREELWRAGMFAGIESLFPRMMSKRSGQAMVVFIVSVLFGLAHTPQGWAGVAVTMMLGLGLGAIMLWHRSIWEAALAHGFFDATTFVFIYVAAKFFPHELPGL